MSLDKSLWEAAVGIQSLLAAERIPNCIIGGVALSRWGEPRATQDVDATLILPFGKEAWVAEVILKSLESRIENPLDFAVRARILLVRDKQGIPLDLSIGGLPFEKQMLDRSSLWSLNDRTPIRTCCAEDLVVLKAFASRPQDWIDIEGVVVRQGAKLDRQQIVGELAPLLELKEEPEIQQRLDEVFAAHPND